MNTYKNTSGNSGVRCYEIGDDFVRVQFREGTIYLYTYCSAGQKNIEHMKKLAKLGRGLSTFISQDVRNLFKKKER